CPAAAAGRALARAAEHGCHDLWWQRPRQSRGDHGQRQTVARAACLRGDLAASDGNHIFRIRGRLSLPPKRTAKREETMVTDHQKTAPLARDAMAYVLAGGRGSRLMELTDRRAKPAVYFGGKSRIIDFALSNALNSGIRRIGVA